MSTAPIPRRRAKSLVKSRKAPLVIAIAIATLGAAGATYAAGVFDDQGIGPQITGAAPPTPVPGYPGWSYAAAASPTGTPCVILATPLGENRVCAVSGADAGMLNAGFVTDEATGERYGFVVGFTRPGGEARASFSDGTSRVSAATDEGAYFVAVTPEDIERGVLPVAIADSAGARLTPDLPREVFEAGLEQS